MPKVGVTYATEGFSCWVCVWDILIQFVQFCHAGIYNGSRRRQRRHLIRKILTRRNTCKESKILQDSPNKATPVHTSDVEHL